MAETRTSRRTSGPTAPRLPRLLLAAVLIIIATTSATVPAEARRHPPGHASAAPRDSTCRDRSESFLRRELHGCRGSRRRALLNERLVERLSGAEVARSDAALAGGRVAGRAQGVAGKNGSGSRCPSWKGIVASTELEARALAPWTIRVDHDPNRYPSRIAMAECLCTGCVEPSAGAFERSLVSVPVVYRMRALYRRACDPASRLYDYERRWVDVPLACTCVVAKIAPELPAS
ncbi:uncharacterized protein LOC116948169 [Petromyzon marinus]|uniref:Interleukin-17C-like n=1 Tax=Petromyzon marinus TaxID=7757 RepID=A0AAJ7TM36_PETMA|nr:interleukin-17C-like [Petromyzon marinus]